MTIIAAKPSETGRPALWLGGAALSGFALPAIMVALTALIAYFPIGRALESESLEFMANALGVMIVLIAVVSGVLFAGAINALFARRWRPLIMAVLFGLGIGFGFMPALYVGTGIRSWAFELFASRSQTLVDAIEQYERATGTPPGSLSDLVPTYLAAIPKTGMAVYPDYKYGATLGECSIKSKWHLWVDVNEFKRHEPAAVLPRAGLRAGTQTRPLQDRGWRLGSRPDRFLKSMPTAADRTPDRSPLRCGLHR
jgi:hypothetical protein